MTPIFHLQCMLLHVDHGVEDKRSADLSRYLSIVTSTIDCPLHRLSSKWIDNATLSALFVDLKRSFSGPRRNTLLVCGSHLEDQVTVCSLEALLEGFDVHLLCDMISARDNRLKPVLLLRLFQAGVVPSSLQQFLYMWLGSETEVHKIEALRQLLESYDSIFDERSA
jgi:hypothetical protein